MSELTVRTNHVPREILHGFELTAKEQAEFDYYNSSDELDSATFFRYQGHIYDIGEFMYCDPTSDIGKLGYIGRHDETFFSCVAIKYPTDEYSGTDYEHVIVALIMC